MEDTEATCLALGGDDLLAMLHRPDPGRARGTAVLLCPPFGWQHDCAYRGLRTWARELARGGYAAARLAFPSTGDSAGGARDPGRLEAWTTAVTGAADWLRKSSGAERVVAIGIGLGGLVAYKAAAEGAGIDDLVLWAVPARGRALLRELRGHHQIIAAAFPEDDREDPDAGRDLELVGYVISEETATSLSELRLTSLELPRASRRVLLLGRDGIAPDAKLLDHLRAGGADVESDDGHDYTDLMANPQQSIAPRRTIALTLDWLARNPAARPKPATVYNTASGVLHCSHDGVAVSETPLWFEGVHGRIFGVLAEPAGGTATGVCTVMLGAGAVPHTGPNRSWVDLGRRWAARGIPTLRIDPGGVGESEGEAPELLEDESFYDRWRDREVATVLDQLAQRGVADRFILGGLCSGAYRGLRRALVDPRVRGLLLLNLYAFEWSHDLVSERGRREAIARGIPNARGHSLDREFFAKAMAYARPDRAWRLMRRSAEREQKLLTVTALDTLRAQRVQTLLLLGRTEPLLSQFERQGLTGQLQRWPNLTLERAPSRDHMYRALWFQRWVYSTLDAAVNRAVASLALAPPAPRASTGAAAR